MNTREAHCGWCGKRIRAAHDVEIRERLTRHARNCSNAARAWLAQSTQQAGQPAKAASRPKGDSAALGLEGEGGESMKTRLETQWPCHTCKAHFVTASDLEADLVPQMQNGPEDSEHDVRKRFHEETVTAAKAEHQAVCR